MKMGTRSVLFGVHQFLLHPWFVFRAWRVVYGRWPKFYQLCAIVTHDLGYLGLPNMDGDEGEIHPERPANIWRRFGKFGDRVADEIVGHSGFYVRYNGCVLSQLYYADKLAGALYPRWLYLLLANLSGEIKEYMDHEKYHNPPDQTQMQWLLKYQASVTRMGFSKREIEFLSDLK